MEKSNNGYSKGHNCAQGQYKWFKTLQAVGKIAWVGNGGGRGLKAW